MNTTTNVTLQVLATGAVAEGIVKMSSDLKLGLILVGVGVVLYAIYEFVPDKKPIQ